MPQEVSATKSRARTRKPGRPRERPRRPSRYALDVKNLTVEFGTLRALENVSLRVPSGRFVGLIGPNGAGKTTLFNVISGFVTPRSGRVRFRGRRITHWPPHLRARVGLGRTFQSVGLDKKETVLENLHIALEVGGLLKELRSLALPRRESDVGSRILLQEVIELLDLAPILRERVASLSTGRAKIIELGCALLRRPSLLLLDEPSAGLGTVETDRMLSVLQRLRAAGQISVLMIEHDMRLAMQAVDYLYVLDFGQLLAEGTPETVRNDPGVIEAYLGLRKGSR